MATKYGLLGITPQDRQQAAWQGLMNLGGALMAGGAPTTDISRRGTGWAAAGPAFTQGYEGNINKAIARNLQGLQMKQTQAGLTASSNKASAIDAFGKGDIAAAMRFDPVVTQALIKGQHLTVGEGETTYQLPIPGSIPAATNRQSLGGTSGASTAMPSAQQPATGTSGSYNPNRPTSVLNLPDAARAPSSSIARPIPPPPLRPGSMSMSQNQAALAPAPPPANQAFLDTSRLPFNTPWGEVPFGELTAPPPEFQFLMKQRPVPTALAPPSSTPTATTTTQQLPGLPPGATILAQGRPKQPYTGTIYDTTKNRWVNDPAYVEREKKIRAAPAFAAAAASEQKKMGEDLVAAYTVRRTAAEAARPQIQNIEAARAILDQSEKGVVLPSVLQYKAGQAAIALGFDPESDMMKTMLGNVGDAQKFMGVMTNLVLAKMQAQAGPQTESDTKLIQGTVAALGHSPAARDFLMRTSAALAYEGIVEEQFWLNHRNNTGSFAGASEAWHEYRDKVPFMGQREVQNADGSVDKRPAFFYDFHRANKHKYSDEEIISEWSRQYGRRT